MMKTVSMLFFVVSLLFTQSTKASVSTSKTIDMKSGWPPLCRYVLMDDNEGLRRFLFKQGIRLRDVFDEVSCVGQDLLGFAATYESLNVSRVMLGKLRRHCVRSHLSSLIKSPEIIAAARRRLTY